MSGSVLSMALVGIEDQKEEEQEVFMWEESKYRGVNLEDPECSGKLSEWRQA